jgi:anti-sigma regulatory factor (Ser/Thr protein kinase)
MADEWPLRTSLELRALPSVVPRARLHARQVLWEWGLTGLSENAELLISELLTNAVRASRLTTTASVVRLWLFSDTTKALMLVWDANPKAPIRMNVTEDAERGRGLLLVETISDRWGWYVPLGMGGKMVWALCSVLYMTEKCYYQQRWKDWERRGCSSRRGMRKDTVQLGKAELRRVIGKPRRREAEQPLESLAAYCQVEPEDAGPVKLGRGAGAGIVLGDNGRERVPPVRGLVRVVAVRSLIAASRSRMTEAPWEPCPRSYA